MVHKICFLEQVDKRSSTSVVPRLLDRLRERDCTVQVWAPEGEAAAVENLVPEADLYLWKSHGRICDSVAAYLAARGANLLNTYLSTIQVRDKLVTTRRLIDAGLPTPDAFYGDSIEQLASAVNCYPVVVKPNSGRRGQQVALVQDVDELRQLNGLSGPLCAQRYVEGNGIDLKVYVIGEQVFAVRRPSPLTPPSQNGRQSSHVSREIRDISLHCGELFGLELYGVDLLETGDGLYVIEVNCFPGYKGVADADLLLADYIVKSAAE